MTAPKLNPKQRAALLAVAAADHQQVEVRADVSGPERAPWGVTINLSTAKALQRRGLLSVAPIGMYRRGARITPAGREAAAELIESEAR